MKSLSTGLETIALGLYFELVLNLGCILELLGCFKQCTQAISYTKYLRISGDGTQESVIFKAPQLITVWNQVSDAMTFCLPVQRDSEETCGKGHNLI